MPIPLDSSFRRARAIGFDWLARVRRGASAVVSDARQVVNRPVREIILGLASVSFIVWAFTLLNDEFLHNTLGFDEQHFVWTGWCVLKGLIPYRDFVEWKGPFTFITHALALGLHGYRDLQFRWFFLYFPLASLIALYLALLTRRIDKLCALALVVVILHLFLGRQFHDTALSDSESIGLSYYFFGVAGLIAWTRFGDKLRAVGVGLLVCCAFSKEPYMPSVFFTWFACFFLEARRDTLRSDAARFLKLTALGGGVVALGLGLYLVPTGGVTYYVRLLRSYSRIYKDPQHAFCVMFGWFRSTGALNDLRTQWTQIRNDFLNVSTLGSVAPFAALFAIFAPRRSILLALTALLTFASGLWAVTASKCGWGHYYVMPMAGLFLCAIVGLDGMTRAIQSARANRIAGWILLAGALAVIAPRLDKEMDQHVRRSFPNAYVDPVPGALDYIAKHTNPTDRIFTTGPPGLYVMADRVGATRECGHLDAVLYGYPGNTDEERLSYIKAQLERSMPKVVVLDPSYEAWREKHMRLLFMPFLRSHGYKQDAERIWLRPN